MPLFFSNCLGELHQEPENTLGISLLCCGLPSKEALPFPHCPHLPRSENTLLHAHTVQGTGCQGMVHQRGPSPLSLSLSFLFPGAQAGGTFKYHPEGHLL